MDIFVLGFWILSVLCVVFFLLTHNFKSTTVSSVDASFRVFQRLYLVVFLLAMAGDWLQGPYVYALYEFYHMTKHDIEVLFVAGFGSSMIFGTFVGSIADKYGRKANCILYGITYGLACVTKHFNNFGILMIGRLLGGIATSILYSAFESWVIYEHHKRGFSEDLLGTLFAHAVLGNSIVAILSGVAAQKAVDVFGFVAPFDLSLAFLVVMCIVIAFKWVENYGDATATTFHSFGAALTAIRTDYKILCLGLIQSLFEGSMYTFVLEWTPALTPASKSPAVLSQPLANTVRPTSDSSERATIPHGYIFAGFMVAIMIGSSVFTLLCKRFTVESFMRPVLFISAVSLLTPIVFPGNQLIIFTGFIVFEICVGIFWPALGTMRGKYVPEATRATVMNFFRVPLNLIVVVILLQNLSMTVIFTCCVIFLFIAAVCQQWLFSLAALSGNLSSTSTISKDDKKPLLDDEKGVLHGDVAEDLEKLVVQTEVQ
jgi:MFS family permease